MMDIRNRFPGAKMNETEAQMLMEAERNTGFECPNESGLAALLLFLRLSATDQQKAIEWMKSDWGA